MRSAMWAIGRYDTARKPDRLHVEHAAGSPRRSTPRCGGRSSRPSAARWCPTCRSPWRACPGCSAATTSARSTDPPWKTCSITPSWLEVDDRLERRQLVPHLEEPLLEAVVLHDGDLRLAVAHQVRDLLGRARVVDRDGGGPEGGHAEVDEVEVRDVPHHQDDAVAGAHPEPLEVGRRPGHVLGVVARRSTRRRCRRAASHGGRPGRGGRATVSRKRLTIVCPSTASSSSCPA